MKISLGVLVSVSSVQLARFTSKRTYGPDTGHTCCDFTRNKIERFPAADEVHGARVS